MKKDWKQEEKFLRGVESARKAQSLRQEIEEAQKAGKPKKEIDRLTNLSHFFEEQGRGLLKEAREERYAFLEEKSKERKKKWEKLKKQKQEQDKRRQKEIEDACQKLGHVYQISDETVIGEGSSSFRGQTNKVGITKVCRVCGKKVIQIREKKPQYASLMHALGVPQMTIPSIPQEHKKMIKRADKKYWEAVNLQMEEVKEELKQIQASREELCELFGHSVRPIIGLENFTCDCCQKDISCKKYVDDFYKATYKGIVPYAYETNPNIL